MAGEFKAHNFILPGGAVRVDEDRFRLPQPWEEAVKFYRLAFPPAKYPRRTLHSQSGVRAMHIVNPHPSRNEDDWEGVNLYEFGRGEVRVFVLAHPLNQTLHLYGPSETALRILALALGFAFVNNAFIGALSASDRQLSFTWAAGWSLAANLGTAGLACRAR